MTTSPCQCGHTRLRRFVGANLHVCRRLPVGERVSLAGGMPRISRWHGVHVEIAIRLGGRIRLCCYKSYYGRSTRPRMPVSLKARRTARFSVQNTTIITILSMHGARAGLTVYPPFRDVASPLARRDHRKSKFGLRHTVKLY